MTTDPLMERWPFPQEFHAFHAFRRHVRDPRFASDREIGFRPIYGTPLADCMQPNRRTENPIPEEPRDIDYMRVGHPYVDRLYVARFELTSVEELECLTSDPDRAAWKERHPDDHRPARSPGRDRGGDRPRAGAQGV